MLVRIYKNTPAQTPPIAVAIKKIYQKGIHDILFLDKLQNHLYFFINSSKTFQVIFPK